MAFTVVITQQAERDVDEIAQFIGAHERDPAATWLAGMLEAMASLEDMPRRCKRAAESEKFSPSSFGN